MEKPDEDFVPKAPGMKYRHYAPKADLIIVRGEANKVADWIIDEAAKSDQKVAILTVNQHIDLYEGKANDSIVASWGDLDNMEDIAHKVFNWLRKIDEMGIDVVYCEAFAEEGLGLAVMNRLTKAAGYQVIDV